jgi:glycosyltransferase involved in cell wall biosynthesis
MSKMNFAIYYVGDGYSTDKKIMGRQSAGKALMKGIARRWKTDEVHGFGVRQANAQAMLKQLQGDGFTGSLRWRETPGDPVLDSLGAVYYPAPPTKDLAHRRNTRGPASYSLFGVTHTLSSTGGMDLIAEMVLPPFKPWDALICTSNAALTVVTRLQDELKAWHAEHTGATRFNPIALPVIPLGVDAPAFSRGAAQVETARRALGLEEDEVAFLFAGRMAFHAKANPASFYQAIEAARGLTSKRLVCVEAGVYPNRSSGQIYAEARSFLAPNVRFIQVDGHNEALYLQAWKAADVFVSLSDNIQETFGLTPLEAMAAGIPVLVSDWDGYRDTVRDGVDGYRIPVTLPEPGPGEAFAHRHAMGEDTYDYYIGRVSMTTAIDLEMLTDRIVALAEDPGLRRTLGEAGRARIQEAYDWPVILDRYVDLMDDLGEIRRAAGPIAPAPWPNRMDPYALFGDYPTKTLKGSWRVEVSAERAGTIETYLALGFANYVLDPILMPRDVILELLHDAQRDNHTVDSLLGFDASQRPARIRALMWLVKLNLISLRP